MRQAEAEQPEAPQDGGEKILRNRAKELDLKTHEPQRAEIAPERERIAHMHPPGDGIAFQPARALLDPGQKPAIGFLVRRGVDQLGPEAMPRQPDAQIGILGHVPGIPAADPFQDVAAKEQGGPAKRHHQPQPGDAGQIGAEPAGIFDGEAACEPVGARVEIVQPPLQAGDIIRSDSKAARDLVQLVGVGPVLGIPDADDIAATEVQRIVQRPWLGLHRAGRHGHDADPMRQRDAFQRRRRDMIGGLGDQQDIGQLARIIEPRQPPDQLSRDIAFVKQRHHDRDHRQPALQLRRAFQPGRDQRPLVRILVRLAQDRGESAGLEDQARKQRQRGPGGQRAHQRHRRKDKPDQNRHDCQCRQSRDPAPVHAAATQMARNALFGLPRQRGRAACHDRRMDAAFGGI